MYESTVVLFLVDDDVTVSLYPLGLDHVEDDIDNDDDDDVNNVHVVVIVVVVVVHEK